MSNVTVQEALKAAIRFARINPHVGMYENSNSNHVVYGAELAKTFEAALSEIDKFEPVAEAIRERDRLGFAVVNVIGKLDEIIENTQEVEIDDFLHIAISIDMWNELQASLEDMPERADLYTTPQRQQPLKRLSLERVMEIYNEMGDAYITDIAIRIMDEMEKINK